MSGWFFLHLLRRAHDFSQTGRLLAACMVLLIASPAAAAETAGGYTFVSTLMLAMLVAAVAVLAWLMKRNATQGSGGSSMRLVAAQALGPRERLVVVHVGSRFFLLGHTANQVSMLAELAPEDVPQPGSRLPENLFADLLKKLKK